MKDQKYLKSKRYEVSREKDLFIKISMIMDSWEAGLTDKQFIDQIITLINKENYKAYEYGIFVGKTTKYFDKKSLVKDEVKYFVREFQKFIKS